MVSKNKTVIKKALYTLVLSVILCLVFWLMISYVYDTAEKNAAEELHIHTKEIKDDINLQLKSDTENLYSLANVASELYTESAKSGKEYSAQSYDFLFKTYEKTGLIDHIGLFFPNNLLMTNMGEHDITGKLSFDEEVKNFTEKKKSYFVSNIVEDYTRENTAIIRDAVPVKITDKATGKEKIVAILYGRIDLESMYKKYTDMLSDESSVLWIIERDKLNFILNSANEKQNLSYIQDTEFFDDYSYKKFGRDIQNGESGYTKFMRPTNSEFVYGHYSKLDHGNWSICLLMPESLVYAGANDIRENLLLIFILIVLIMIIYIIIMMTSERKSSMLYFRASQIRKQLLEVTMNPDVIDITLESIANHTKSNMVFFSDTDADESIFIIPNKNQNLISPENKESLVMELLSYSAKHRESIEFSALVHKIIANNQTQKEYPAIYNLMKQSNIKSVCFATVINKKRRASIIGVTNPSSTFFSCKLLKEIAICFSMSIFNRNYLEQTENIAVTDSLTGLYNRMAYKKDLSYYDEINSKKFSCIYIDIDGLHMFNNKFGHNAGDGMLLYIANAAKDSFDTSKIYRMGGDEYVIFSDGILKDELENRLKILLDKVNEANYHISYGVEYSNGSTSPDILIEKAEKKMYERKAMYYQEKDSKTIPAQVDLTSEHIETGIRDLNEALNAISKRYIGIYSVSLDSDEAKHILSPNYLNIVTENQKFKDVYSQYIQSMVSSDYHRALSSFMNYDALKDQIKKDYIPCVTYEKISGERIKLSIHGFSDSKNNPNETIWMFERID